MVSYLALDVGAARVGLALANDVAKLAAPLPALLNDAAFLDNLRQIVNEHQVNQLVVGLPRGLSGQETAQTQAVQQFIEGLRGLNLPIAEQDEALTSVQAETELRGRGRPFAKAEIDSLSAVYILEDYLNTLK